MKASKATAMLGIVALGSFAVACGGGDSTEGTGSGENACPQKLTIQTDWFPELEHGGTYQLIGEGGAIGALQLIDFLFGDFQASLLRPLQLGALINQLLQSLPQQLLPPRQGASLL